MSITDVIGNIPYRLALAVRLDRSAVYLATESIAHGVDGGGGGRADVQVHGARRPGDRHPARDDEAVERRPSSG